MSRDTGEDEQQPSLFGEAGGGPARQLVKPRWLRGPEAEDAPEHARPLAARMRPRTLDEVLGQEHLLAPGRALRRAHGARPGALDDPVGAAGQRQDDARQRHRRARTHARFVALSAVTAGVADLRRVVEDAAKLLRATGQRTILFIDEIHRFYKSQQDAILPHVERGTVILIGATTENPSFEVNAALLSRTRVFTLRALSDEDILRAAAPRAGGCRARPGRASGSRSATRR